MNVRFIERAIAIAGVIGLGAGGFEYMRLKYAVADASDRLTKLEQQIVASMSKPALQGPPGERGLAGADGVQGQAGPMGPAGPKGEVFVSTGSQSEKLEIECKRRVREGMPEGTAVHFLSSSTDFYGDLTLSGTLNYYVQSGLKRHAFACFMSVKTSNVTHRISIE